MSVIQSVINAKRAVSGAALTGLTAVAFAQTAPQTPVELLAAHSTTFLSDSKDVMFAGAGLIIGALLTMKLVRLVIGFFQKG